MNTAIVFFGSFYVVNTIEGLGVSQKLGISILVLLAYLLMNMTLNICSEMFEDISAGGPIKAQHVKLQKNGGTPLNIAEIEVLDASGNNIASGAQCTASSTLGPFSPNWLVDGNLDNFAHTLDGEDIWFNIDLGREVEISSIKIHNRKTCCQDRIIGSQLVLLSSTNEEIYRSDKLSRGDMLYIFTFAPQTTTAVPMVPEVTTTAVPMVPEVTTTAVPEVTTTAVPMVPEVTTTAVPMVPEVPASQQAAVPQSQDELRRKLSAEQDARDKAAESSPNAKKPLFEPAVVMENQVAAARIDAERVKTVELDRISDNEPSDDFTIVHPKFWLEINTHKPLCNYKCELQPVVLTGDTSKFLPIRGITNTLADKYLKKTN